MESFTKLFGSLLVFVYHCFDRIVHQRISGASGKARTSSSLLPGILGVQEITKIALSKRTQEYRQWVEAASRIQKIPMQWADAWLPPQLP